MAVVKETLSGHDGRVRNVKIGYKNLPSTESASTYKDTKFTIVDRPVHRLIVLVAADDNQSSGGGV